MAAPSWTCRSRIRLECRGAPVPAAWGRDAAAVQPVSDLAERRPARLHGQDEREQVGRPLGRLGRHRGVALGAAAELVGEVGRIAQLNAARLGRQNVGGQAVGLEASRCSRRRDRPHRRATAEAIGQRATCWPTRRPSYWLRFIRTLPLPSSTLSDRQEFGPGGILILNLWMTLPCPV
jgi:hypothetical protein